MVDRELEALKLEFLSEAKAKVLEMTKAVDGGRDSESLQRLAYLAHQLKGSGGSYGYAHISNDAAEIEKTVEQITSGGSHEDAESLLKAKVASLKAAVDDAEKEVAG